MAFDYKKEYREFYMPPSKPGIITVPSMNYIAVRGQGDPNAEEGEYKQSIGLLYGIAFTQNDYTKLIDYDKIKFNLQLRTRQEEDFICVYSDGRSKKLGRFMIEQKIPAEYRDRVLVVADGNEIVWIVGFRMSERYKAQDTTINTAMISVGNGSGGDDGEDIRINQPEGGGDKNSRDSRAD